MTKIITNDPIKVIFLDIDGVLNSDISMNKNFKKYGCSSISDIPDREHVECLDHIVRETNCKIVLSSTWKILSFWNHIEMLLLASGLSKQCFIGETKNLHTKRGLEIDAFIKNWNNRIFRGDGLCDSNTMHVTRSYGPIERFVILDDDSDMAPHMDKLVQTQFKFGLTKTECELAIKLLNG